MASEKIPTISPYKTIPSEIGQLYPELSSSDSTGPPKVFYFLKARLGAPAKKERRQPIIWSRFLENCIDMEKNLA